MPQIEVKLNIGVTSDIKQDEADFYNREATIEDIESGNFDFDSINNLYNLAHNVMELKDDDTLKFIQDKLTRDYNEISDELKYLIDDKYNNVMTAKSINDIISTTV